MTLATDSGSYAVDMTALTDHASKLGDLAGQLQSALTAEGSATVADDAFGQTGQPFAAALRSFDQASQGTLQAGITAMDTASTRLRTTTTAYEQQETTTASRFAAIGGIEAGITQPPAILAPPAGAGALTS